MVALLFLLLFLFIYFGLQRRAKERQILIEDERIFNVNLNMFIRYTNKTGIPCKYIGENTWRIG